MTDARCCESTARSLARSSFPVTVLFFSLSFFRVHDTGPTDRPSEQLAAAAPLSTKLSYVALFLSHAHNESMMGRMRQTDIRRARADAAMAGPRTQAARARGGRRTKIHHLTLSRENIQIHERANIGGGKRGGEEKRLERGRGMGGREREWMYQAEDVRVSERAGH